MCRAMRKTDDKRELRNSLGQFPTGVAIATTHSDVGKPVGMTINSFNSISMAPPLIAWCVDRKAASYSIFAKAKQFAVTLLAADQFHLAKRFATPGVDKFSDIPDKNMPLLIPGGCAWFTCVHHRKVLLGDHLMLVAEIIDYQCSLKQPLVFAQGQYQQLAINPRQFAA